MNAGKISKAGGNPAFESAVAPWRDIETKVVRL
jgi:hypothetical protein